jgi:hypothetical protein
MASVYYNTYSRQLMKTSQTNFNKVCVTKTLPRPILTCGSEAWTIRKQYGKNSSQLK